MIPWECKHSIARAISSANPTATRGSRHRGLMLSMYFRSDPPSRSSVTTTITGSLQAPMNCTQNFRCHQSRLTRKKKEHKSIPKSNKSRKDLNKILVLHFSKHRDLPHESGLPLGHLLGGVTFMHNLDCNILILIPIKNEKKNPIPIWWTSNHSRFFFKKWERLTCPRRLWHGRLLRSWGQRKEAWDQ